MNAVPPVPVFTVGATMTAKEEVLRIPGLGSPARAEEYGDSAAWEETVRSHGRMLYRIAYSVLRHHQDAEDAVQETLQRAWRYRHRLAMVEDPAAWLARIGWRVAKSRRQRIGLVSTEEIEAIVTLRASGANAEELATQRQMQALVDSLVATLPAKLRQPLLLSTVEELSGREIAYILRIPEASVRSRCLRARRLLREKIHERLRAAGVRSGGQEPSRGGSL